MTQEQFELRGPRRSMDFPNNTAPSSPEVHVTPPSSPDVHVTPPSSPAFSPRRSTRPVVANPRYFGSALDTDVPSRPTRGRGRARGSDQRGRGTTLRRVGTGFMDESSDEDQRC
jgi:hypothetical protein